MTSTPVFLVANPHAGGGKARKVAHHAASRLCDRGLDIELVLPESFADMQRALADIEKANPHVLLACGGDGTVNQVLQSSMRVECVLGVIPGGTGNDIARCLGITQDHIDPWLDQLSEMLHSGLSSPIDVSRIQHGDRTLWCLGVMSAGFDSAVNERADRLTFLRGTLRYVAALLLELKVFTMHTFTVTVDHTHHSGQALLVAVGNSSRYGGGMRICPDADMRDGLLDVTWVGTAPRRTVLRVFPRIFSGSHVQHPLVRTFRGQRVEIEATGAMIYADGERVGQAPVSIEVVSGGLRVLRPLMG